MKIPVKIDFKKIMIALTFLLIMTVVYFYNTTSYVVIRFNELGALTKNMSAYYNGFKIGKIISIQPDNDFKHTLVKVILIYKNLKLPQNTTVKVENFPNGELYLQFVYPQSPSLKLIKRGDVLEGTAPYSLEGFMLGQNISGVTDIVSLHVIRALQATEISNQEMQAFFKHTSKLIDGNSASIKRSVNNAETMTKNLSQMAQNLNRTSKKLDNSINENDLRTTTTNIKKSSSNVEEATSKLAETTYNIAKATENIDQTIKKVDETISQASSIASNLNSLSGGLNQTLSQRFAGMRMIFGTPIKQKNKIKNACK